jgi:hypothetical protein
MAGDVYFSMLSPHVINTPSPKEILTSQWRMEKKIQNQNQANQPNVARNWPSTFF